MPVARHGRAAARISKGIRCSGEWGRPCRAVVAAVVGVVLDAQELGEHLRPTPAGAAELVDPTFVVVGRAPMAPSRSPMTSRPRPGRGHRPATRLDARRVATSAGQMRSGSMSAWRKFALWTARGRAGRRVVSPARATTPRCSDPRTGAASTAPAEPAPTTTMSKSSMREFAVFGYPNVVITCPKPGVVSKVGTVVATTPSR